MLDIDTAIKHCLEVAEQNETQADKIGRQFIGSAMDKRATDCRECAADHRQLAEWLTELKEARKLLTATKYKVKHEEWDMHGEHYIGDYALCPNCNKCFTNIYNGKAAPVVTFCPDCGQKIDWND
jgi:hypothetical protein